MKYFDGRGNMDTQKFDVFLKAIETGSITRAANAMGYSQSAISHAISSLEDELNVRLLLRDRAGVRLTKEGEALLPYIRNVISSYQEFQNKLAKIHNLEYGTIKIGTFTSVAVHWLPNILSTFRVLYPSINFEVKQGNYAQIIEWIKDGIIDCGFTVSPQVSGIRNVLLKEDRLFVIYHPDHPLGMLKNIRPEDIGAYPFILVDEGNDPIIRNFFEDRKISLNIQYRVVDDYAVVAMVESNLGISVCPELFFYRLPFNVVHRAINTDYRRRISISYKDNFTLSPVVFRFIQHIQRWISENTYPLPEM